MFTRRHIRIKVMQAVYALHKDPEETFTAVRKKFDKQLLGAYDLYFVMYALLIAIHKRAIERFEIKNKQEHRKRSTLDTSPNFVENKLLRFLGAHPLLNEKIKKKKNQELGAALRLCRSIN